jgi:putative phosphoribosyl transferase
VLPLPYKNRYEAGRILADSLRQYTGRTDVLVLGLPRGGVPIASAIADSLGVPMDLLLVRKLGLPGQEELAIGAIACGGVVVMNDPLVQATQLSGEVIDAVVERERQELQRREREYRGERAPAEIKDKCVILVDDGLATGSTMRAAVAAIKLLAPRRVVVAVPVASQEAIEAVRLEVDEIVCPAIPTSFRAVGQWYTEFSQVTDQEVRSLLSRAWKTRTEHA